MGTLLDVYVLSKVSAKRKTREATLGDILVGAAVAPSASVAAILGGMGMGRLSLRKGKPMTPEELTDLKKLLRKQPVYIEQMAHQPRVISKGILGKGQPLEHGIFLRRKGAVSEAFHEAGHVMTELAGPKRRAISIAAMKGERPLAIAGLLASIYPHWKAITDPHSTLAKSSPWLALAVNPITYRLPGEAAASLWALAKIRKLYGAGMAMRALGRLGPAFGTYLLGATAPAIGIEIARRYMVKRLAKKRMPA